MNFIKTFAFLLMLGTLITPLTSANAQITFSHSISGTWFFSSAASAPGVVYSPRLNIAPLGDNANISIGSHIGLGFSFSGSSNTQTGTTRSSSFLIDLPLVAELNLGHASDMDNYSGFGFFAGGGVGYNRMSVNVDGFGEKGSAFGPLVNVGIRFPIRERSWMARASYLIGITGTKHNVFGLGVGTTFGMN